MRDPLNISSFDPKRSLYLQWTIAATLLRSIPWKRGRRSTRSHTNCIVIASGAPRLGQLFCYLGHNKNRKVCSDVVNCAPSSCELGWKLMQCFSNKSSKQEDLRAFYYSLPKWSQALTETVARNRSKSFEERFEREKEQALEKLREEHQKEIQLLEQRFSESQLLNLEQKWVMDHKQTRSSSMNNTVTFRYLLEIQRLEEERKSLRQEKVCGQTNLVPFSIRELFEDIKWRVISDHK